MKMLILAIAVLVSSCSTSEQQSVFQYHKVDSPYIVGTYFNEWGNYVVATELRIKKNGKHKLQIMNAEEGMTEIEVSEVRKHWYSSEYRLIFELEALEIEARDTENTLVIVLEFEKQR